MILNEEKDLVGCTSLIRDERATTQIPRSTLEMTQSRGTTQFSRGCEFARSLAPSARPPSLGMTDWFILADRAREFSRHIHRLTFQAGVPPAQSAHERPIVPALRLRTMSSEIRPPAAGIAIKHSEQNKPLNQGPLVHDNRVATGAFPLPVSGL